MAVSTQMRVTFKGVDKTAGTVNKMRSNMMGTIGKIAASFAGMFAAKAIAGQIRRVIQEVHAINDEARQVGANVEFFQALGNAFGQVGLNAQIAGKSLDFMRRNLATKTDMANNIFEQMGLDADKLKKMGTEEMFFTIGQEIAKLPNEIDRVKASYEIFGRSGSKLAPLFRQGPEAFMEGLKGVMGMMPVVDQRIADSMSNIDDTFAVIKQTIFVDWANALGHAGKVGEESFGQVEIAIFKTFLKIREFSKNFVATLAWIKDSTKAIFTDDTLAASFDRVLDKFDANMKETAEKLEAFKKGLKAKEDLAGLFDAANNGAAELKKNIKVIKQQLTGMTLAGSYAAVQARFRGADAAGGFNARARGLFFGGQQGRENLSKWLQVIAQNTEKTARGVNDIQPAEAI